MDSAKNLFGICAVVLTCGCQLLLPDFKKIDDVAVDDEGDDGTADVEADREADGRDTPDAGDEGPDMEDAEDLDAQEEGEMPPECGNGETEEGEDCDDRMNGDDLDGCTDACAFTCTADDLVLCDDANPCTGEEGCDEGTHTCTAGTPLDEGDVCATSPVRRICHEDRSCVESTCGDGIVDTGGDESCDPPSTPGCTENCRWYCTASTGCADDGNACNGEEY